MNVFDETISRLEAELSVLRNRRRSADCGPTIVGYHDGALHESRPSSAECCIAAKCERLQMDVLPWYFEVIRLLMLAGF